jgi:hypothetical protein
MTTSCDIFDWCVGRGAGHTVHVGEDELPITLTDYDEGGEEHGRLVVRTLAVAFENSSFRIPGNILLGLVGPSEAIQTHLNLAQARAVRDLLDTAIGNLSRTQVRGLK